MFDELKEVKHFKEMKGLQSKLEPYLEPRRALKPLTIFEKSCIRDVQLGSK